MYNAVLLGRPRRLGAAAIWAIGEPQRWMMRRDEQLRGRASHSSGEPVGAHAGFGQSMSRTQTKAEVGIPADAEVGLLGNCS